MSSDAWLIVGLGNPGPTYASHRHNIGAMVVDELARRQHSKFKSNKIVRADVVETHAADRSSVVLAKPFSYMNDSGGPVKALMSYYKIDADHLVIVHDELDLDFGTMRAKFGGGDNGHNGLKSIRASIGTGDFYRVRVAIGRPKTKDDVANFVLTNYSATERKELPFQIGRAADAIETLIGEGLETAQSRFNS